MNYKITTREQHATTENYIPQVEPFSPEEHEILESEDFKKYQEYKKMWEWLGELIEGEDIKAIESYLAEIGQTAIRRKEEQAKGTTYRVQEWIGTTSGYWTTTKLYHELHITTKDEKKAAYQAVLRELSKGIIERHPKESGTFRRIERELIRLDWRTASETPLPFEWGLGLDDYFVCYQKNIIVVASHPDGGKTAYLLRWVMANQVKVKKLYGRQVLYLVNDMGEQEFRKRISLHKDMPQEKWHLDEVYERDSHFEDVILPDGVTIIDFIQEDEPYKVGTTLKRIHQKLKTGICIVALQKPFDRDLGYGKEYSMHYPRLYMIFDTKRDEKGVYGMAKVLKCKNRKGNESLTGKSIRFKLVGGCKFTTEGIWYYEGDDPYDKTMKKIGG